MADYSEVPPTEAMRKAFAVGDRSAVHAFQDSREQFWPGSAMAIWQGHSDAVLALIKSKQAYGDSWVRQGYMGNIGRVLSKADRLRNLMWRDLNQDESAPDSPDNETVLDTLYDLSALCALAIANIEEGNRWGK